MNLASMESLAALAYRVRNALRRRLGIHYKKSYAQCGEDLILRYVFDVLKVHKPTYLDIGAHHPTFLSNTYLFYLGGSTGVSIEPDPVLWARINRKRRRDHNLNVGVAATKGEMTLYVFSSRTMNTFSANEARLYQEQGAVLLQTRLVPVITVSEAINQFFPEAAPDFVSVDVEGMDLEILRAFDFDKTRPIAFCVETITYSKGGGGAKIAEIDDLMHTHGYFRYADTYINSIYVEESKWRKAI